MKLNVRLRERGPRLLAIPLFFLGCACTAPGHVHGRPPSQTKPAAATCSLAIVHVNVVPMDREHERRDQSVIVDGGRIRAIVADAGVRCDVTIDGAGRYLVPGLNDLHVHLETAAFAEAFHVVADPADYPSVLALYVANGVTGVRVMSGAPDILSFRDEQRRAHGPYPRLVVATPMLSGDPPILPEPVTKVVRTAEAAREAVSDFAKAGYDFVKVRDNLPQAALHAAIDEAHRVGLYVDGHLSRDQGLSVLDVLDSGQKGIAHLDELAQRIHEEKVAPDAAVKRLREHDCFVSSTLGIEPNILGQLENYESMAGRKAIRFMDPMLLNAFWLAPKNPYLREHPDTTFLRETHASSKALLKTLIDGGVPVVAGSDALNPMILPGEGLHDELSIMVEAGLSPYQALATTTATPASEVPGFQDVGQLVPGRLANAVLVKGDPLRDIRVLRDPEAVMIEGHWLNRVDLARALDAAAAHARGAAHGPGSYQLAAHRSEILVSEGVGDANVEDHAPFIASTVIRIASLTKQFTAAAVLRLVSEGKLSLDEPLSRAYPRCPPKWRGITLAQLLSHTSGITDDMAPVYARMKQDLTPDELIALFADRPLASTPGAAWRYSNANYWALGRVIELASGEPYADYVTRHVLAPGMTRTRYGSHDEIVDRRAAGYERRADGSFQNAPYFGATLGYAAGGFLSTPADLAKWYAALAGGSIVPAALLDLALTPVKTTDGKSTGYGLGWYVSEIAGDRVAHHGGSTLGFRDYVYWMPSRQVFAGVFENHTDEKGEPQEKARALFIDAVRRAR